MKTAKLNVLNLFTLRDDGEDFVDLVVAELAEFVVAGGHGDLDLRRLEIGGNYVLQSCDSLEMFR